jgi:Flp pilus assembly protein TadG
MRCLLQLFIGRRARLGGPAVEFALIAPVLIAVLIAMTDLGIAVYQWIDVQSAAQAGAQFAVKYGYTQSAVQTAVTSATDLAGVSATPAPVQACGCASGTSYLAASCGSSCADGSTAGTYVTVSAQAQYSTILSYPGLDNPMTLTGQATVRIQ